MQMPELINCLYKQSESKWLSGGNSQLVSATAIQLDRQLKTNIPYSGKFSPGVNFRQFRQSCRVAKI